MYEMNLRRNKWCVCIGRRCIIKQINERILYILYMYKNTRLSRWTGRIDVVSSGCRRSVRRWEVRRVHPAAASPAPLDERREGGARKRYSDLDPHRRRALRVPVLPPPHYHTWGRGGGRSTRPALGDICARASSSFFTHSPRPSSLKYTYYCNNNNNMSMYT